MLDANTLSSFDGMHDAAIGIKWDLHLTQCTHHWWLTWNHLWGPYVWSNHLTTSGTLTAFITSRATFHARNISRRADASEHRSDAYIVRAPLCPSYPQRYYRPLPRSRSNLRRCEWRTPETTEPIRHRSGHRRRSASSASPWRGRGGGPSGLCREFTMWNPETSAGWCRGSPAHRRRLHPLRCRSRLWSMTAPSLWTRIPWLEVG